MSIAQNFPEIRPSLNLDFANTKKLDSRITFSRPTSAVYYDGQTVTKAEENLVKYSQEFDNGYWGKLRTTVTANASVAPDGTTTADAIFETVDNSTHLVRVTSISAGTYTASAFVKANGRNYFALYASGPNVGKYFDVTAGGGGSVLGDVTGAPTSASLVYLGNDYYRVSITFTAVSTFELQLYLSDTGSSLSYAGDVTKGVFLWGAQLEQRSSATAYTPTTTQPITNYIPTLLTAPANTARFDHDPVTGESLGLLVEEQRTNLQTYSEDFSNAVYVATNSTLTPNQVVAPDGTLTGYKLTETATTGEHFFQRPTVRPAITSGAVYTFSWYAKKAQRTKMRIYSFAFNNLTVFYDLELGVATYSSGGTSYAFGMQDVGNGWWRCFATSAASATVHTVALGLVSTGTTTAYTGDGYSGIYIWGAQLEAGAFPTSYIKTEASQVTRSADSASMTGANFSEWYRADEGSLVFDIADPKKSLNNQPLIGFAATGQSVSANSIALWASSGTALRYRIASNGAYTVDYSGNTYSGGFYALSYKVNDSTLVRNGASITTDTTCSMPSGIDTFNLIWESRTGNTTIKKIAYYPARLTNTQLQALTS
jgi:hypothetical protein